MTTKNDNDFANLFSMDTKNHEVYNITL